MGVGGQEGPFERRSDRVLGALGEYALLLRAVHAHEQAHEGDGGRLAVLADQLGHAVELLALAGRVEDGLARPALRCGHLGGEIETLVEEPQKLGVDTVDAAAYLGEVHLLPAF